MTIRIVRPDQLPEGFFVSEPEAEVLRVREILKMVRSEGDRALRRFSLEFDGCSPEPLRIDPQVITTALRRTPPDLVAALQFAADRIRRFADFQMESFRDRTLEIASGVFTGQRVLPIARVGVYVPGGRHPLPSSLLMTVIPARVAGVGEIAVCSPPRGARGTIDPVTLAAAGVAGVEEIYALGGVQAIGALAYGTESVKRVDKIVGPGNRLVSMAKREVLGVVGIDMLAGPTEVMIVADDGASPRFIAADLLAQAEHDPLASAVLITPSAELAERVQKELDRQLAALPEPATAAASLAANGLIVLVGDLAETADICNRKAPEHLELHLREAETMQGLFTAFGTLFVGEYAVEALGDYTSGLNHTLPTSGWARFSQGLSVRDFVRTATVFRVSRQGFPGVAVPAVTLARAEGLEAHARSLEARLESPFPE